MTDSFYQSMICRVEYDATRDIADLRQYADKLDYAAAAFGEHRNELIELASTFRAMASMAADATERIRAMNDAISVAAADRRSGLGDPTPAHPYGQD